MSGSTTNPKVDEFFSRDQKWLDEMKALRRIALDCELVEELKWNKPCYSIDGGIVGMIGPFKDYCIISFFKGALLKDPNKILVQQTENVQSARIVKFTNVSEIAAMEGVLKAYIQEAIAVEKSGVEVESKKSAEITIIEELQAKFDENPALKVAFEALTPGRQRGYVLHFSQPKQSATRTSRIEKCMNLILSGKGLSD